MAETAPVPRTALIAGAGPSGLAAALMLHQRGWERIIVLEANASATDFDKNRGFNYLIDARGQKLLDQLGIADRLGRYAVENRRNIMTVVGADGHQKTFKSPFWDPRRDMAWWSRRERFQSLLADRIAELDDGRIELRFGERFEGLEAMSNGRPRALTARVDGTDGDSLAVDLLLGCDGLRSRVRAAMAQHSSQPPDAFEQVKYPSPSSVLRYKVLQMPAAVPIQDDRPPADDHRMAYAFLSRDLGPRGTLALVAYPVPGADEPRTVNIIRLADHRVWEQESPEALLAFLEDAFPQLAIRDLISPGEAADFVATPAPKFPSPQYTRTAFAMAGGDGGLACLLLGDAAHAFPPDLGLGVNTALEDVWHLGRHLAGHDDDPRAAGAAFEREQAAERAALVRLVQTVAPYQYNQYPRRLKLWALRFFAVRALNRVLPFLVDSPAVLLAQQDELPFTEIRRRQQLNRWRVGALAASLVAAGSWLAA